MADLASLQRTAQEIGADVGLRVVVLPTSVPGMGYEVSVNGHTYGPFKSDAARLWLNGLWVGASIPTRSVIH